MAASKATAKTDPSTNGGGSVSAADDDFFNGLEEGGAPDIDGWWSAESMKPIRGKCVAVIGMTNDDGKPREVVLVKLTRPTTATTGSGNNKETVQLEVGQVAAVGVTAKLSELLYFVEKKGEVAIMPTEKVKLSKGRTMWKYKTHFDEGKRSKDPARPLAKMGAKGDADTDIPF